MRSTYSAPSQKELEEAIDLIRCGDFDIRSGKNLIDNPRLPELMRLIGQNARYVDTPNLSQWPTGYGLKEVIFWFKVAGLMREYCGKRPLARNELTFFEDLDVDNLLDDITALADDAGQVECPEEERIDRIRLLRASIRYILSRTNETYQLNENTGRNFDGVRDQLDRLLTLTDLVLHSDKQNTYFSLRAEILYQKGRVERARGINFVEAERNFTECLKLARKRLQRYDGDPGEPGVSREFRHSSYLAAMVFHQLAFLAFLQGRLSISRRMITASWFVTHQCRDRRIKAEVQYMTATVRRALTTDTEKLKGLEQILEEADRTLGELGIVRERQMAKHELILTRIYLKDYDSAEIAVREMSELANNEGYWDYRAKTLGAIVAFHRYDNSHLNQLRNSTLMKARKYAEAAVKGFKKLADYRSELVQAYYIEAEVNIRVFAETRSKLARKTVENCLAQAEKLNSNPDKQPLFGEMNNQHNRGAIVLIGCQMAIETGDLPAAEELLKTWDQDIKPHVETMWLHTLADRLRARIPLQRQMLEIDINKDSNQLYDEMLRVHYNLIKSHLIKTNQKSTDQVISQRMQISINTLKKKGIIPRKNSWNSE